MNEETAKDENQDAQPAPTGAFSDAPVEVSGQSQPADDPVALPADVALPAADATGEDTLPGGSPATGDGSQASEPSAEPLETSSDPIEVPFLMNEFRISGPLAETSGYISSSFGLNLTGKAAHNLARLLAGLQRAALPVNDGNSAINWLLEQI